MHVAFRNGTKITITIESVGAKDNPDIKAMLATVVSRDEPSARRSPVAYIHGRVAEVDPRVKPGAPAAVEISAPPAIPGRGPGRTGSTGRRGPARTPIPG
jgi:hypothetical protein